MKKIIIPILLVIVAISCKKENADRGSLIGYVEVYDANGEKSLSQSGVTVKANKIETTTDAEGRYELEKLTALYNYTIEFSKSNINTYKDFNVMILGGENFNGTTKLLKSPTTGIQNLALEVDSSNSWNIKPKLVGLLTNKEVSDSASVKILIQYSTNPDPSISADVMYTDMMKENLSVDNDSISLNIQGFIGNFDDGETVYVSAWVCNSGIDYASEAYYTDFDNKSYFIGVGTIASTSFIYDEDLWY